MQCRVWAGLARTRAAARVSESNLASVSVAALALATFAMSISACGNEPAHAVQPWDVGPYSTFIEDLATRAKDGGASDAQLALLQRAKSDGKVTFAITRESVMNTINCFTAGGLTGTYRESTRSFGLVVPGYDASISATAMTEDQMSSIAAACAVSESRWVLTAFQVQPTSRELLGAYVESREPELRACLENVGAEPDPKATAWELAQQAADETSLANGGVDCLVDAGIDGL